MSPALPPPLVLSFAASDPTGGAGLQADLLTIAALGGHPLSVLTALTVQDTSGVTRVRAIEADLVAAQASCLLADMPVRAFKLGVLGSRENAAVVADILERHPEVPVVCDPVLASGRGDLLAADDPVPALRELILPRCTLATPNSLEARRLAGREDLEACARALLEMGSKYVLITGTHEASEDVVNVLYGPHGTGRKPVVLRKDAWPRLPGSYHGSGCTLASAIACHLAAGCAVEEAARHAQEFTWQSLKAGFAAGRGQRLPDRFFKIRPLREHRR
jgi:hydroxymethylpyrimidine/phosphomethylpyrimidine kinase